jgi:hypothetical protein
MTTRIQQIEALAAVILELSKTYMLNSSTNPNDPIQVNLADRVFSMGCLTEPEFEVPAQEFTSERIQQILSTMDLPDSPAIYLCPDNALIQLEDLQDDEIYIEDASWVETIEMHNAKYHYPIFKD